MTALGNVVVGLCEWGDNPRCRGEPHSQRFLPFYFFTFLLLKVRNHLYDYLVAL